MSNYPKFAEWAKLREALVVNDPNRGTSTDSDQALLTDFENMIKRDGGISQAVKSVYKHQMQVNPDIVPKLQAIVKKYKSATTQTTTAPADAPAPDPNTMSAGKRGKLNTEIRAAIQDWIAKKVLLPANDKIPPEKIVQSGPFKQLIAPLPQKDRDTVTQETIRSIAEKRKAKFTADNHAAADAAFAKKDAAAAAAKTPTSGPTATPTAPAAAGTPKKGGFFSNWLSGRGS